MNITGIENKTDISKCFVSLYLFGVDVLLFDQPHTPSFPIGFVKTESDFTARSVNTGLRSR